MVPCLSWSTASSSFIEVSLSLSLPLSPSLPLALTLSLQGLLSRTVCWDVLEAQLADCLSGRDERRRECFRRIKDLETATLSSSRDSTSPLGKETTSEALPQRELWWLNSALESASPTDRTLSFSSAREGERGQPLSRGPVMTASFHGVSSLLQLAQGSLTGLRERARREARVPERELGRGRRNPRPELLEAMRMVLDSWTHHQNFPLPLAPSLAHFVTAEEDAYIPRRHLTDVRLLWQGGRG